MKQAQFVVECVFEGDQVLYIVRSAQTGQIAHVYFDSTGLSEFFIEFESKFNNENEKGNN